MTIAPNPKGAVLTGVFDKSDPAKLKADVAHFTAQLTALQKKLGFTAFVPLVTEEGPKVTIVIVPASAGAPGATGVNALRSTLGKLTDTYQGTGELREAAETQVAGYEAKSTGSFLEDPDFAG